MKDIKFNSNPTHAMNQDGADTATVTPNDRVNKNKVFNRLKKI